MLLTIDVLRTRVMEQAGIQLDESARGRLSQVADLSENIWEEALRLKDPYLMVEYLSHFLGPEEWPDIKALVVKRLGRDYFRSYTKGGIWIFCCSLKKVLIYDQEALLEPFETSIHNTVLPTLELWHQGGGLAGAMVVAIMSGCADLTIDKEFLPMPQIGKVVALDMIDTGASQYTRWIAQGIAWHLYKNASLQYPIDKGLLQTVAPEFLWTADAHKAIAGLNRELQEDLVNLETTVPGYGGPDEWYL